MGWNCRGQGVGQVEIKGLNRQDQGVKGVGNVQIKVNYEFRDKRSFKKKKNNNIQCFLELVYQGSIKITMKIPRFNYF